MRRFLLSRSRFTCSGSSLEELSEIHRDELTVQDELHMTNQNDRPRPPKNVVEILDTLLLFKGNVYFVTQKNQSSCTGAQPLVKEGRFPSLSDVTLGRVKFTEVDGKYLFALPKKSKVNG